MIRYRIFIDLDAEERYLSRQAEKGYQLVKYSYGFYHFTKGEPKKMIYKLDYHTFHNITEFNDYRSLFLDAGWKHVSGTMYSGYQYFTPIDEKAGTEIFSDNESAAARYKLLLSSCLTNFSLMVLNMVIVFNAGQNWFRSFGFLTPGLWDMTGFEFWRAFLIELPFAFLRVGIPVILIVLTIVFGVMCFKARKLSKIQNDKQSE